MLFNSLEFLIFFPIAVIMYFIIPKKVRYLWLLGTSYYFYMCWNAQYALLMLTSTAITWVSGFAISRQKSLLWRKIAVAASFTINLAILFYFKYYYFTVDNINAVRQWLGLAELVPRFDVILPVGISFYTFQALSYTVDVYRGDIEHESNFFKYALFVSFFPQLVAGPIERSANLIVQFREDRPFNFLYARSGFLLMLWGYFLKLVIADRAAVFVDSVYDSTGGYSGTMFLFATLLFAVQIYCDFASYTAIARGAARILGFELMKNFEQPYFSHSIAEFWRNWHISLSSWFRDYLYIPLGGNRKGRARKYINIMIVFLASGLWHGASWNYVVWGFLHGFYQIIGDFTREGRLIVSKRLGIDRSSSSFRRFEQIITFALVCFAWIFFRSQDLNNAFDIIIKIFTDTRPWELWDGAILSAGLDSANLILLLLAIGVLYIVSRLENNGIKVADHIEATSLPVRWLCYYALLFAVLILGVYGPSFSDSQFIYFQF